MINSQPVKARSFLIELNLGLDDKVNGTSLPKPESKTGDSRRTEKPGGLGVIQRGG